MQTFLTLNINIRVITLNQAFDSFSERKLLLALLLCKAVSDRLKNIVNTSSIRFFQEEGKNEHFETVTFVACTFKPIGVIDFMATRAQQI